MAKKNENFSVIGVAFLAKHRLQVTHHLVLISRNHRSTVRLVSSMSSPEIYYPSLQVRSGPPATPPGNMINFVL